MACFKTELIKPKRFAPEQRQTVHMSTAHWKESQQGKQLLLLRGCQHRDEMGVQGEDGSHRRGREVRGGPGSPGPLSAAFHKN